MQPGNGMPISRKNTGESGDSRKVDSLQVNAALKRNNKAQAIAVQPAVLRKSKELIPIGNLQIYGFCGLLNDTLKGGIFPGIFPGFFRFLSKDGKADGQQQGKDQE